MLDTYRILEDKLKLNRRKYVLSAVILCFDQFTASVFSNFDFKIDRIEFYVYMVLNQTLCSGDRPVG